jgi:hypothetical protein
MTTFLIVTAGTPSEEATALAVANGCAGFYQGVPPILQAQAQAESWTLPCTVTEDENGVVVSWAPVA